MVSRLSESLSEGGTGNGRRAVGLLGQRRPEGTTTHILLLLCWGRREGWRNNLDGLGLIKEKRERKETKKKNSTKCKTELYTAADLKGSSHLLVSEVFIIIINYS